MYMCVCARADVDVQKYAATAAAAAVPLQDKGSSSPLVPPDLPNSGCCPIALWKPPTCIPPPGWHQWHTTCHAQRVRPHSLGKVILILAAAAAAAAARRLPRCIKVGALVTAATVRPSPAAAQPAQPSMPAQAHDAWRTTEGEAFGCRHVCPARARWQQGL